MEPQLSQLIGLILLLPLLQNGVNVKSDDDNFILETKSLPVEQSLMPQLANGHLGLTVFGDGIFMDGVYNGRGGNSRRARIPNWLNISVVDVQTSSGHGMLLRTTNYGLNLREGIFFYQQTVASNDSVSKEATAGDGLLMTIEQRIYAHRFFDRALVYELAVKRTKTIPPLKEQLLLKLASHSGPVSDAFTFEFDKVAGSEYKVLKGVTKEVENEQFQATPRTVFAVFSEDFESDEIVLKMEPEQEQLYYRLVVTIDESRDVALKELLDVLKLTDVKLFQTHSDEWRKFWQQFNIAVEGNVELARTINAGVFYLASCLPSPNTNQKRTPGFGGLSPTGLGRGNLDIDYEGHNFWDTEVWMLPVVHHFSVDWAKTLLQYRIDRLKGAIYNANQTGFPGARFPWESAYTGTEVINPLYPEIAAQQVHISADIVWALEQHLVKTQDSAWLCSVARPVVAAVAQFLESRVTWQADTQQYHVVGVIGPDEDHENVTDNVYTNVLFKKGLEFATYTERLCGNKSMPRWTNISEHLFINYDAQLDYHPQHTGYQPTEQVKQADVILLGYPIQFPMNESTRRNDLLTYQRNTRSSGPAMTWSMFAINFLDIGDNHRADLNFAKSYTEYVRAPFRVWSENPGNHTGASNFLTGVGGFLQALLNGYGGLRFHREDKQSVMEIRKRTPLPATTKWSITGIQFVHSTFSLTVTSTKTSYLACDQLGSIPLEIVVGNQPPQPIKQGVNVPLNSEVAFVRTT